MKVLVIEDDPSIAETVREWLTANFHTVEIATDGAEGSFLARSYDYDAIILDYCLPKKDGIAVCKEVRSTGKNTPILFLSVVDDTETKVSALNQGADDYLAKPFSLQELQARLSALARRPIQIAGRLLQVDDLQLDCDKHIATRGSDEIRFTRKEFALLEYFMKNPGMVLSRALLMEHVWTADSDPFSNTVEAHIRNLRKKLNAGDKANMIANVPARGYVLDTPEKLRKR